MNFDRSAWMVLCLSVLNASWHPTWQPSGSDVSAQVPSLGLKHPTIPDPIFLHVSCIYQFYSYLLEDGFITVHFVQSVGANIIIYICICTLVLISIRTSIKRYNVGCCILLGLYAAYYAFYASLQLDSSLQAAQADPLALFALGDGRFL